MTIGLLFWIVFIVGLLGDGVLTVAYYRMKPDSVRPAYIDRWVFWLLIGLLGYGVFGFK